MSDLWISGSLVVDSTGVSPPVKGVAHLKTRTRYTFPPRRLVHDVLSIHNSILHPAFTQHEAWSRLVERLGGECTRSHVHI